MTYEQLLTSEKWLYKRNAIVKRDKFKCKKCDNLFILNDSENKPAFIDFKWIQECIKFKSFKYKVLDIRNKNFVYIYNKSILHNCNTDLIIYYNDNPLDPGSRYVQSVRKALSCEIDEYRHKIRTAKETEIIKLQEDVEKGKITPAQWAAEVARRIFENSSDLKILTEVNIDKKDLRGLEWVHVNGLNVHHTYYQMNLLPWQYPENTLETFCQPCHEALHNSIKVPVLDENGNEISRMTTCLRCCGSGWFYQYKHIEGGICFRCKGARYEELI